MINTNVYFRQTLFLVDLLFIRLVAVHSLVAYFIVIKLLMAQFLVVCLFVCDSSPDR